jgi:hypothetical protein
MADNEEIGVKITGSETVTPAVESTKSSLGTLPGASAGASASFDKMSGSADNLTASTRLLTAQSINLSGAVTKNLDDVALAYIGMARLADGTIVTAEAAAKLTAETKSAEEAFNTAYAAAHAYEDQTRVLSAAVAEAAEVGALNKKAVGDMSLAYRAYVGDLTAAEQSAPAFIKGLGLANANAQILKAGMLEGAEGVTLLSEAQIINSASTSDFIKILKASESGLTSFTPEMVLVAKATQGTKTAFDEALSSTAIMAKATEALGAESLNTAQRIAVVKVAVLEEQAALEIANSGFLKTGLTASQTTMRVRALSDEISGGRLRQGLGTLTNVILSMATANGASIGLAVGVLGAAAAAGFLAYEIISLNNEMNRLTGTLQLQGRASENAKGFIIEQSDAMHDMHGVSRTMADDILQVELAQAHLSAEMMNNVNQMVPLFVAAYGDKAPEAVGKLVKALNDLTENSLKALDREMANLDPATYELAQKLLLVGDKAGAAQLVLDAMAARGKTGIKSLDEQAKELVKTIDALNAAYLQTAASGVQGSDMAAAALSRQLDKARAELAGINEQIAKSKQDQTDNRSKDEFDAAEKINNVLSDRELIIRNIAKFQADAAGASNSTEFESFTAAAAKEQEKLNKLIMQENKSQFANFVAQQEDMVSETKRGSAERIAALEREAAEAARVFGAGSTEALKADAKIGAERRTAAAEGKRLTDEQYRAQIASLAAQGQAFSGGSSERIAILAKEAAIAIRTYGYGSTQFSEIEKEMTANLRVNAEQQTAAEISAMNVRGALYDKDYASTVQMLSEKVRTHELTAAQVEALEKRMADAIYAIQLGLLNKEAALGNLSVQQAQRIANQKELIEKNRVARVQKAEATADAVREQRVLAASNAINRTANQEVLSIIRGQQTLLGAVGNIGSQMVAQFVEASLRRVVAWAAHSAIIQAITHSETIANIAEWLFGDDAAVVGSKVSALSQITDNAAIAGSAAFASTAAIPIVGPGLAPAAGAAAVTADMAYAGLLSSAGGVEIPSGVNPLIQAHAQETVLPADLAVPLGKALRSGKFGGGGDTHIHIHATDADSFAKQLSNASSHLSKLMRDSVRSFDPNMKGFAQ